MVSDYAELSVIRCLYDRLDTCVEDKFNTKGRRCILLGYPPQQKAYKLYDLDTHITFVNRDVKFFVDILPFKGQSLPCHLMPNISLFLKHPSSL